MENNDLTLTSLTADFRKSENILSDIKLIIDSSQNQAVQAVNTMLVKRNWLIGYRIAEEELSSSDRAKYGAEVIIKLSKELTQLYGKGFDRSNLYHYLKFYNYFPNIVDTLCRQSPLLSWSHYRVLLQVEDETARTWYENEAQSQTWSVRTLQRNISTQYYYRLLQTQNKDDVKKEMTEKTGIFETEKNRKLEFIKNPMITEFLGLPQNNDFTETDLESSILSNL